MQHSRARLVASTLILLACGLFQAELSYGADSPRWVASWIASPSDDSFPTDPGLILEPLAWTNQTVRNVIAPHLGGSQLRLHLTNRFSSSATTFGHVTVGYQTSGANASFPTTVTFGGSASVTVAPGADVVSDPVNFTFTAFEPLAVSIYLPGIQGSISKHWNSNATTYCSILLLSGDQTNAWSGLSYPISINSWFYLDGLDVVASSATKTIVAFGDSITDGFVSGTIASLPESSAPVNVNGRYPDVLQRRVEAAGLPISVINAGISDNELLTAGTGPGGPSGLSRLSQDALTQAGVSGVILLEGINDLGLAGATAATLEAGYTQAIAAAHAAGVKIWLGTILPAANAVIDGTLLAPQSETYREQINAWIRSQTLADGVVDFDAALRDPTNPTVLNPQYASVDNLHPNLAGYQEMANIIPLSMF
jgi:lysophospholipase L1-like esterase